MTSVHPGHAGQRFRVRFVEMTPPRRFAWQWHPGAVDPAVDYSNEPRTTVTFTLEPSGAGTQLTVAETGFDADLAGTAREGLRRQQPGLDRSAWSGCSDMPKRRVELGLAEAALLFAALGDETRLALLRRLSEGGPASITELSRELPRLAAGDHEASAVPRRRRDHRRQARGPGACVGAESGPAERSAALPGDHRARLGRCFGPVEAAAGRGLKGRR